MFTGSIYVVQKSKLCQDPTNWLGKNNYSPSTYTQTTATMGHLLFYRVTKKAAEVEAFVAKLKSWPRKREAVKCRASKVSDGKPVGFLLTLQKICLGIVGERGHQLQQLFVLDNAFSDE